MIVDDSRYYSQGSCRAVLDEDKKGMFVMMYADDGCVAGYYDVRTVCEDSMDQPVEAYMPKLPYKINAKDIVTDKQNIKWN